MAAAPKKTQPAAAPAASPARHWLTGVGILLLLTWCTWWFVSLRQLAPRLVLGSPLGTTEHFTTIPTFSLVGLDFQHNYAGAQTWLRGENPYRAMSNDPINARYIYPPLTLGAFAWTHFFPVSGALPVRLLRQDGEFVFYYSPKAVHLWFAVSVAIVVLAAWWSARARAQIGTSALPLALVLGAILLSYPVMFELERGNCHVLVLLAMLGLTWSLSRSRGWTADLVGAVCLFLAAGIKGFPGILIVGLFALRRYRAGLLAAGFLAIFAGVLWHAIVAWLQVVRDQTSAEATSYYDFAHSLAMHWHILWRDLHLAGLAGIPATPAVVTVVLAVVGHVSWRVFKSKSPAAIAWPYLLWLTAMGTMVNKIAIDYGLIFVPLALIVVWDVRDRWWSHVILAACLLWCQPLYLGVSGATLLLLKFLSVSAVGLLICRRVTAVDNSGALA